jgi:hypothetical protein
MQQRNPIAVFLLPFVTFGIYSWYWCVKTKGEMNKLGENIPTAWVWLIPIVGTLWWLWKYSEGVEHVSKGKTSGVLTFVLLLLLGSIGQAIIQDSFNKISTAPADQPAEAPKTDEQPVEEKPADIPPQTPPEVS